MNNFPAVRVQEGSERLQITEGICGHGDSRK